MVLHQSTERKKMTHHTMVLSKPDSLNPNFINRYYATIDISMPNNSWIWQQVDANGKHVGPVSAPFASEDQAKNDSLQKLNGDEWE
jgi:hypothetical protein